jgi:hypothetical protein
MPRDLQDTGHPQIRRIHTYRTHRYIHTYRHTHTDTWTLIHDADMFVCTQTDERTTRPDSDIHSTDDTHTHTHTYIHTYITHT